MAVAARNDCPVSGSSCPAPFTVFHSSWFCSRIFQGALDGWHQSRHRPSDAQMIHPQQRAGGGVFLSDARQPLCCMVVPDHRLHTADVPAATLIGVYALVT